MKEKAINMHKRNAMGESGIGFNKGGLISNTKKAKCYAEGGSVAETYAGGTGVNRDDMTGKRVKMKDGDVSNYKKGGKVGKKK